MKIDEATEGKPLHDRRRVPWWICADEKSGIHSLKTGEA